MIETRAAGGKGRSRETGPAGVRKEDTEALKMLATQSGARVVVAVQGEVEPRALLALCEAVRATGGRLISLVPSAREADALKGAFEQAGLSKTARVYAGDPLRRLGRVRDSIDMLFLGKGMDYADALAQAAAKLGPGSIVVAQDGVGALEYLEAVADDPSFETTLLGNGSELTVSLRKS